MTGEDHRRRRGADEGRDPAPKGLLDDLPETGRGPGSASPSESAPEPGTETAPGRQRPNPFHTPADRRGVGRGGDTQRQRSEQPNVIPFRGGGSGRGRDEEASKDAPEPPASQEPQPPRARHESPPEPAAPEQPEQPERPAPARQERPHEPAPADQRERDAEPRHRPTRPAEQRRRSGPAWPSTGVPGPERDRAPASGQASQSEPAPEPAREPAPEPPRERDRAPAAAPPAQDRSHEPAPERSHAPEPERAPEPPPERAPERESPRPGYRPAPMAPQYPPRSRAALSDIAGPASGQAGGPASSGSAPAGRTASSRSAPPPAPEASAPGGAETGPLTPNEDDDSPVNAHAAASFPEHPDDRAEERAAEQQPHEAAAAAPEPQRETAPRAEPGRHAYADTERDAVYRAIRERRDVRMGFRPDPIPDAVLRRVLDAAHRAPSVGYSQPWDFIVVEDDDVRARVQHLVQTQRESYARALPGARARAFSGLKVEAILDTPLNIVVTVDPTRGGRHTLGRHSQPQTAAYSAALAVENLWLAARAEGLGVGWVSFFEERELAESLDLPPQLEIVSYLCVGYVEDFPPEPELAMAGWSRGRPLHWAVHRDHYGRRGLPGEAATSLLEETIAAIGPLNQRAVNDAEERQAAMTKPPGSLGVLEEVSVRLSGLVGECPPPIPEPAAVAIFAGDHGVHAQGVSGWPQEVTAQMVHNFLDDGAVVNAFAEQVGAEVTIVDVGVAADLPTVPGLLPRKIARGTADFTQGPAMTRTQVDYAIEAGIEVARDLVSAGNRCLVTGDMGIANTTPSAALVSAFTGTDPADVTGRGTGADDAMLERKIEVVRRGLAANDVDPADPVGVLAAVGGLEHAALSGFILGAAALRVPVLLDGVIAGAAALAAAAMEPLSLNACFAGHRSTEPGHSAVLTHIGLSPLVDLEMRLGEGSGALLALPMLQGSVRALRNVATFDTAGVSERG